MGPSPHRSGSTPTTTSPPLARGVVVLGMHRSGTSAVAGLLHLAGIPLPAAEFVRGAGHEGNPKGYWEIWPLNKVNESLLNAMGGHWSAPPPLPEGWTEDPRAQEARSRGVALLRDLMPSDAWLWKDPRLCLTLPIWNGVAAEAPVVFLVVRSPLDVSASLKRRNGFTHRHSLALWERYTSAAVAAAEGAPVSVVAYERIVADPVGWSEEARSWVLEHGVRCRPAGSPEDVRRLVGPVRPDAGRSSASPNDDLDLSAQQRTLFERTLGCLGMHERFDPPDLGEVTPWALELLEERRASRPADAGRDGLKGAAARLLRRGRRR